MHLLILRFSDDGLVRSSAMQRNASDANRVQQPSQFSPENQTLDLKGFKEVSHRWAERMQFETELASTLSARLTGARSPFDVAAAYQEWMARHMEAAVADSRCTMIAIQNWAETVGKLLAKSQRT